MIFVIMGIAVALIVLGIFVCANSYDDFIGGCTIGVGVVIFVIALIVAIILGVSVGKLDTVDERIAMYEEENTEIEEQIAEVVASYQEYETGIFKEVAPESAMTLVALYPDLKSDILVQSQIDIYVKNNETIKELKEEKINGSVTRWWLYFGK